MHAFEEDLGESATLLDGGAGEARAEDGEGGAQELAQSGGSGEPNFFLNILLSASPLWAVVVALVLLAVAVGELVFWVRLADALDDDDDDDGDGRFPLADVFRLGEAAVLALAAVLLLESVIVHVRSRSPTGLVSADPHWVLRSQAVLDRWLWLVLMYGFVLAIVQAQIVGTMERDGPFLFAGIWTVWLLALLAEACYHAGVPSSSYSAATGSYKETRGVERRPGPRSDRLAFSAFLLFALAPEIGLVMAKLLVPVALSWFLILSPLWLLHGVIFLSVFHPYRFRPCIDQFPIMFLTALGLSPSVMWLYFLCTALDGDLGIVGNSYALLFLPIIILHAAFAIVVALFLASAFTRCRWRR